ncbi:MAG TPA: ornithine decarboxylase, partial [Clostridiaceae bacterium]|nr:ornithine decarboxylase [Clostridiaceae bacterium]
MDKYKGYTIRQLCQEMHDFYKDREVKDLQKKLFRKDFLPEYVMTPQEANIRFVRGEGELIALNAIEGRMALEG